MEENKNILFSQKYLEDKSYRFKIRSVLARSVKIDTKIGKKLVLDMRGRNDDEIKEMIELHAKKMSPDAIKRKYSDKHYKNTHKGAVRQIAKNLFILHKQDTSTIKTYLDFGCGEGRLAFSFKNRFDLDDNNIYGLDIREDEIAKKMEIIKNIVIYDGINIPFEKEQFDLITISQVLHHIPENDIGKILEQLNKILKPNKYIVIKEHDCQDDKMRSIIDIQHYCCSLRYGREYEKGRYRTKEEWKKLFLKHGFKEVSFFYEPKDIFKSYNSLFRKI